MSKEKQKQLLIEMMELDEKDGLYDLPTPLTINVHPHPTSIRFHLKHDEPPIIVIDEKGFTYKGELIEDSGEVYRLFKEFLIQAQNK